MRTVTRREDTAKCQSALTRALASCATESAPHRASFRPGGLTAPTFFFRDSGFWAMLTDGSGLAKSKNRYWNCFGQGGQPSIASERIVVEINHPHEGPPRTNGRFLADDGRFYIAHNGGLGGGVLGAGSGALERLTGHRSKSVDVDGRRTALAFIAPLDDPLMLSMALGDYVRLIALARRRLVGVA